MSHPADEIVAAVKGAQLGVPRSLYATWNFVASVCGQGVPGNLAECGVFAGVHVAVMAKALEWCGEAGRKVHLFDSFVGLPRAGLGDCEDIAPLTGRATGPGVEASGKSACSRRQVEAYMEAWGVDPALLVYHEGWFQDVLPRLPADLTLAFLRLDADMHESTRVCLEALWPRLSPGGVLVVDDWPLAGCRRAVQNFFGGLGRPWKVEEIPETSGNVWMVKP